MIEMVMKGREVCFQTCLPFIVVLFHFHPRELCPSGSIMRRFVFLSHVESAVTLNSEKNRTRPNCPVDGVDGSGKAFIPLIGLMVGKE